MIINHEVITDAQLQTRIRVLFVALTHTRDLFDWERQETTAIAHPDRISKPIRANIPHPFK